MALWRKQVPEAYRQGSTVAGDVEQVRYDHQATVGKQARGDPANRGRHGAHGVRVFGSLARGEADAARDVDFLVELEPGRSLLDLGAPRLEFEALVGRRVDVITGRPLLHPFLPATVGGRISRPPPTG